MLALTRGGLASSGLAVATVAARAVDPPPASLPASSSTSMAAHKTPPRRLCQKPRSPPGDTKYDFYSLEVVQRIGYDSFTPDSGVLLSKNLDNERGRRPRLPPFTYVIDAHPEDIHMVDFKRPHGEPVMRTVADYRQLNDALFHAGLNSGSQFEWEDAPNRLHFYIVDVHHDAQGFLSYTVAVRSLDGAGPQTRGMQLRAAANCSFTLTNTGKAAEGAPAPQNFDVYRLTATGAQLANALAAVKFGESQPSRSIPPAPDQ